MQILALQLVNQKFDIVLHDDTVNMLSSDMQDILMIVIQAC